MSMFAPFPKSEKLSVYAQWKIPIRSSVFGQHCIDVKDDLIKDFLLILSRNGGFPVSELSLGRSVNRIDPSELKKKILKEQTSIPTARRKRKFIFPSLESKIKSEKGFAIITLTCKKRRKCKSVNIRVTPQGEQKIWIKGTFFFLYRCEQTSK